MATTKDRINISVSKDVRKALARLARRYEVPEATKAADLIHMALEIEEDRYFSELADTRLKKSTKWLTHEEVWGKKIGTR